MVEITLEGCLEAEVRDALQQLSDSNLRIQEIAQKASSYKEMAEKVKNIDNSITRLTLCSSESIISHIEMFGKFLLSEPNFKQYLKTLPEHTISAADRNTIHTVLGAIYDKYSTQSEDYCNQLEQEMQRKEDVAYQLSGKLPERKPVDLGELVKKQSIWKTAGIAAAETLLAVAILGYTACRYGPEIKEYLFPEKTDNRYEVQK